MAKSMDLYYLKLITEYRDPLERQGSALVNDHLKMSKYLQSLEKELASLKHLQMLNKYSSDPTAQDS